MSQITAERRIRALGRKQLLVATALAAIAVAAPAGAQTYFAREVIKSSSQTRQEAPPNWSAGPWSAYSSGCSATATQTRSVVCAKPDGSPAPDTSCAGPKPDAARSEPKFAGCSYSATYGQYTACAQGLQSAAIVSCTRSDGTPVSLQTCPAQTDTRPCTVVQATCSSMTSGTWYKRGSGTINALGIGFASNEAEALNICNQHIAGTTKSGMCAWSSESTPGSVTFVTGAATGSYPWAPYLHLGTCQ